MKQYPGIKRLLYVAFISVFFQSFSFAQLTRKEMADDYFNMYEFSLAEPIYSELASGSIKRKKAGIDEYSIRRAAECNILINDYTNAEKWFENLFTYHLQNEADYISYVKTLFILKKYERAFMLIDEAHRKYPLNSFFKAYSNGSELLSDIIQDSARYEISETGINSIYNEFSPSYYLNGLVYASQAKNKGYWGEKYLWDGTYFTQINYTEIGKDGNVSSSSNKFSNSFSSFLHDGPVCFNKDYTMAFITRNDQNKKYVNKSKLANVKLYISIKNNKNEWSEPTEFPYNSNDYSVGQASMSPDGKFLFFTSDMPGGYGETDIWKSSFENGVWGKPVNCGPAINTPYQEMFPYMAEDSIFYFSSNGHFGLGGLDFMKVYNEDGQFFVENMGAKINSSYDDFGIILDSTGNNGFITSNRPVGKNTSDNIYKIKIYDPVFTLHIVALDAQTHLPLPNAEVVLTNLTFQSNKTFITDSLGRIDTELRKRSDFVIEGHKTNYTSLGTDSASTKSKSVTEVFESVILMEPNYLTLEGKITDVDSKRMLNQVNLYFIQPEKNETIYFNTSDSSRYRVKLKPGSKYLITVGRDGYMETIDSISIENLHASSFKVKDFTLKKKPEVNDIFVLDNIYYDYGSATLREESKIELDKLFDYLQKNPTIIIELSSHTDSRSSYSFNLKLSQARAQSCVDYLIEKGVDKSRIKAKGYSYSRLVNNCPPGVECSEEEHQKNRRTEIKILKLN